MKNWIKESRFYHIYPLGFCGAPRFYEATITHRLPMIETIIDNLKELNINAIYLGPVFASYEHGYDTSDYRRIDPRLGSNDDFKHLCDALHNAGIKIVLDGVFNHVGREFWAFQDVQTNREASPYASWFHNINFSNHSPMNDSFSYEAWEGHYNLVKLNLHNDEVVQHLLDSVGMWMDEFHIDGLRLDAADCIEPSFFKRLKQYTKQKREDFWLMGEIIHGDYTRWANPEMLDSVTNYECYKGLYSSHNTKNYFEIAYSLNRQFGNGGIYKDLTLYNFVDNHDVNRLASLVEEPQHLFNIYTLEYTMPGIPSIYYGSEYALKGTKHDGSDADIRPSLEAIQKENKNDALYQHLCRLGNIRNAYPALSYGSYEQIVIRNEQFIFKRQMEDQCMYIALNLSDVDAPMRIQDGVDHYYDVLHEETLNADASGCILIPSHQARILTTQLPTKKVKTKKTVSKKVKEAIKVEERKEPTPILEQPLTPVLSTFKIGRYQHFKGNHYAVLYIAKHSETSEDMVVYRQLYGDGGVWVRPLSMFLETIEHDGIQQPRFTYLGK